jgi:hypothetical protein
VNRGPFLDQNLPESSNCVYKRADSSKNLRIRCLHDRRTGDYTAVLAMWKLMGERVREYLKEEHLDENIENA